MTTDDQQLPPLPPEVLAPTDHLERRPVELEAALSAQDSFVPMPSLAKVIEKQIYPYDAPQEAALSARSMSAAWGSAGPTGLAAPPSFTPAGLNGPTGPSNSYVEPGYVATGYVGNEEPRSTDVDLTVQASANVSLTKEVIRAPFSEIGIAERLEQNPDFFRQLLQVAAEQLRKQAETFPLNPGDNSAHVVISELNARAEKLEMAASVLDTKASDRFAAAAKIVVEARDQIARFAEAYPTFTNVLLELSGVVFGCYVLHQIGGAQADVAAFVSYAVVRKEKLSEILAAWRKGGSPPPGPT